MIYFAYGSNMNLEHMRRLCGWHFRVLGSAKLEGYEFGPDTRGYANIRPANSSEVHGVIYDLDQHCLNVLDEFEGYPHIFNRIEVEVKDIKLQKYKAWVYVESPDKFDKNALIKSDYLKRVISGAVENKLSAQWIKFLKSFDK